MDAPSLGPENAFRISIPDESAPVLDGDGDRVDVAFTIVPPVTGPVTLVHSKDGREIGRWALKANPDPAVSTRCRLSSSGAMSACEASIGDLPHSAAGEWSIEANGNHVLEVGLAFRSCR